MSTSLKSNQKSKSKRPMGGSPSKDSAASGAETETFIQEAISSNCVVIFSKTSCGYCGMAKQVFDKIGVPYEAIELNKRQDGSEIQKILQKMTGGRTVPRVFVNGQCIGGGTETVTLNDQGKLLPLVGKCPNTKSS